MTKSARKSATAADEKQQNNTINSEYED